MEKVIERNSSLVVIPGTDSSKGNHTNVNRDLKEPAMRV